VDAQPSLPSPRGGLSGRLIETLAGEPRPLSGLAAPDDDALVGEDFQLALYLLYELHYRGFAGVDEDWEWEPSLLALRSSLEREFEARLRELTGPVDVDPRAVAERLIALAADTPGPPLGRFIETQATVDQVREFVILRSAYQLKQADPHSWAIARLSGRPKVALVEIQADEYGGGRPDRIHAGLFAKTMAALGLDPSYGAYLDAIPGARLATVNLMSLFGLHRRLRGAIVGHLALFEMTSTQPNRRYGNALRRLGFDDEATDFFDEHVEADAVHEALAAHDLAGALATDEPAIAADIVFGATALAELDAVVDQQVYDAWQAGRSALLQRVAEPV
jgi:hypothetical protein